MTEHSPIPWKLDEDSDIRDANGRIICGLFKRHRPKRKNLPFIVRACNSHQALVDALRVMLKTHEIITAKDWQPCDCSACEQARAALAMAEVVTKEKT